MSIYRFVTKKKLIGSNVIHQTSNIAYFNHFSRQFSIVNEGLNSPEISDQDENDPYLQSLTQKSLLNDDNIQSGIDLLNQHRQHRYNERLQQKAQKSSQYDTYPEIFRQINNATSGQQIKQIVLDHIPDSNDLLSHIERLAKYHIDQDKDDTETKTESISSSPKKPAIFTHAIRACFTLKQHKFGWDLYEIARERNCVSNDLYSLVLFGKVHEKATNQSLQTCFDIFDQWKEEEKRGGLHITAKIYTSLIAQCLKIRNFGKAFHVYNHLMMKDLDKDTLKKVLHSPSVRQEIVNLFVKSQGIEAALGFVSDCKMKHGVIPTQNILCTLITGCAAEINKNPDLLEIAEKLFAMSFDVLQTEDTERGRTRIFSSLLVVYSKIGDYRSCIDLLNRMQEDESWPKPDKYCIAPALKAITVHNLKMEHMENEECTQHKLNTKEKWELIDNILSIQRENNLDHDVITYSILINLCSGDRDKMIELYKDMVEKDKIMPNRMALQNILLGGLDGYYQDIKLEKEENNIVNRDKEITEFIDWVLTEMNRYNLSVSENFRVKLKGKLDNIKSLQ